MSKETRQWLSENVLIGFTEKRGNAWHYREGDQNHYIGPVPIEDVRGRLFNWHAEERPLYIETAIPGQDGEEDDSIMLPIDGRKAIVRSDTNAVMGIFKEGYLPHQYDEWLLTDVANILDDDLQIGSAGLLRGGAVAWVSVEVPETFSTPDGITFRPNLLSATSFDGSLATTRKRVVTNTVCDNTMNAAFAEEGKTFRVKHSRFSGKRLQDAREALDLVYRIKGDFEEQVARMIGFKTTDQQFEEIIDRIAPMPEVTDTNKKSVTQAENKRDTLWRLWAKDERVAPWTGTAYGAWQALNTFQHHERTVKGISRPERNMLNAVIGETQKSDLDSLAHIGAVLHLEMAA